MPSAHETLGVSSTATAAEIRTRYLQLVREFPPDRAPERFAEIRAAFDELRDPGPQLERRLFSLSTNDSLDALQNELRARLNLAKLPSAVLLSLADAP
ncbi:MAG: DnaJ domain-containing protein [Gemmataceae bacterium]|nr:DnaJ domain-containing protein [Gemmataceae bacterium]